MTGIPTDEIDAQRGTSSADRVADVLLAFSSGDSRLGVTELARRLGLSKAVVHRILQSLVGKGLIQYSAATRDYRLGPAAVTLGARALTEVDVRDLARDELIALRNATQETTTLSLLVNERRAYVEQYESPREIKMTVELGRSYPLHAGGSSRAILAHLPDADRERILRGPLPGLTSETITFRDELRESLRETREQGYATSRGERQSGAASVAAPVFGAGGTVVGAISVCGPSSRFDDAAMARFIPLVLECAERITRRLGGHAA